MLNPSQITLLGSTTPQPLVNSNSNNNDIDNNNNNNHLDNEDDDDEGNNVQPRQLQTVNSYNDSSYNVRRPPEVNDTELNSPEPKHLPAVFPYQTCLSIAKTARGASVRIVSSALELDIYSGKVPYIARELFGVIIQPEHGRLYLRLDSGANASFDTLRLAGADHEAAKRILGQVYSAVQHDMHFVREFERGEVLTSFITLEMKGDIRENSCLCIQGNALSISWIASQLWPGVSRT